MPVNDGGPAFPVIPPLDGNDREAAGYPYPSTGLTVRDYFAIHAPPTPGWFWHMKTGMLDESNIEVEWRWHYADRMIARRDKQSAEE